MKAIGYIVSIIVPLTGFVFCWTEWAAALGHCPEWYTPTIVWPYPPMATVGMGFVTIGALSNLIANEAK